MFNASITAVIRRYAYRRAWVTKRICQIEFTHGDDISDFRQSLGKVDNHTCYKVAGYGDIVYYVQFSDSVMYVGLDIQEKMW